ncbi:MAG TPA: methyltransferase [Bacteroidales bacterium]|nr:methyltransferase [Bacteroidales bacterium]HSA43643.1 methyltransferase [Bacteroidales bacterium]
MFSLSDDGCAMPLSSDAVILGAWTNPAGCSRILDVGTGCGILALMMAQKSLAVIDAIDIHLPSATRAEENFRASPWPDRLKAFHASLQAWLPPQGASYDLIISNPPFFRNALLPQSEKKRLSKHGQALTMDGLLSQVSGLLGSGGFFSVLLQASDENICCAAAARYGLFPSGILRIRPAPDKALHRVCMRFGRASGGLVVEELQLRQSDGIYSDAYRKLTVDFYPAF